MIETVRPVPASELDRRRWEHGELRYRLLEGLWGQDLKQALTEFFHADVLERLTSPDMSRNLLRSLTEQTNALHIDDPLVLADGIDEMPEIITPYLWPLRQECQRLTLGMNEAYMRVDYRPGRGITYRVVPHSFIGTTIADPLYPDRPIYVEELVPRYPTPNKTVWTWETWDCRDPRNPVFKIELPAKTPDAPREDVTEQFAGATEFPYPGRDGRPVFPYILCHKAVGQRLYSDRRGVEGVDATIKGAVLLTFWINGVRDCAHPQRVGVDIEEPVGRSRRNGGGPTKITLDQSALLLVRSRNGQSGHLDTLQPTMDPRSMGEAIADYLRGAAVEAGLSPSDVHLEGGVGMSGYAISVSRDGIRRATKRQMPAARLADQQILATAARLCNAREGTRYPEHPEDYSVSYAQIGKSPEEVSHEIAEVEKLIEMGLATEVDAMLRLHPEMDERQALAKVVDVIRTRKLLAALREAPLDVVVERDRLQLEDRRLLDVTPDTDTDTDTDEEDEADAR